MPLGVDKAHIARIRYGVACGVGKRRRRSSGQLEALGEAEASGFLV